jgi:rubrerythrin
MSDPSRMPRYDVRNDGIGPYAVFYCDKCDREYRSQPDIGGTIANDVGRQAASDVLRRIPLFGRAVADSVAGEDPRYTMNLTPPQLEKAWGQVKQYYRECPTCRQILCLSDFDEKSGFCQDDSPRAGEIAQAQAEQAAGIAKGFANVFGLGGAIKQASEAAQRAANATTARCPKDGALAAPGTKFCPECGTAMIQPPSARCPKCGIDVRGAKFCPDCGTKIEQAPAPAKCPSCGADAQGAKFCPECGAKIA